MKPRLVNVLVLLASAGICLGVIEMALRLLGMASPILYRLDERYGYEPLPDQSSTRLGVPIHTNDLGLRDDEDCSSMRSSRSILVVGDSVTYGGSRIRQEDLFTEVLERLLQAEGPGTKVLNAGVNGYSVFQMTERAVALMEKIDIDRIIFYLIRGDFTRAPVTFITEENFIYPMNRPRSALGDFLRLSTLFLDRRYGLLPAGFREWLEPERPFEVPSYDESSVVEIHLKALEEFASTWESSGRGRDDILIVMAPYAEDLATPGNVNADLIARLEAMRLPARDLEAGFRASIGTRDVKDYYWDGVHYTEKGHSLAAEALYEALRELRADPESSD